MFKINLLLKTNFLSIATHGSFSPPPGGGIESFLFQNFAVGRSPALPEQYLIEHSVLNCTEISFSSRKTSQPPPFPFTAATGWRINSLKTSIRICMCDLLCLGRLPLRCNVTTGQSRLYLALTKWKTKQSGRQDSAAEPNIKMQKNKTMFSRRKSSFMSSCIICTQR